MKASPKHLLVAALVAPAVQAGDNPHLAGVDNPLRVGAPVVVEIVNFACPHCRLESTYVPRVARAATAAGGRLEVAPLQPAPGNAPAASVLAYYAEITAYPQYGVQAADAFYAGYAQGAALSSAHSALAWLGLQGLPTAKAYGLVGRPQLTARWTKALRLAGMVHLATYPTFVVINQDTGAIQRVFRWRGRTGQLTGRVVRYLKTQGTT